MIVLAIRPRGSRYAEQEKKRTLGFNWQKVDKPPEEGIEVYTCTCTCTCA